jgi:catechol 2,3-dioxygenase-like lactoylglutathione lyase family enzyme
MPIELNHTIVAARDPQASTQFLAGILGLQVDPPLAHFTPITLANQVTLDYDQSPDSIQPCHYAFLAADEEFDAAFARIQDAGVTTASVDGKALVRRCFWPVLVSGASGEGNSPAWSAD